MEAVARIGWWLLTGSEAPELSAVPQKLGEALLACADPDPRVRADAADLARRLEDCADCEDCEGGAGSSSWTDAQSEAFWQQIPVRAAWRDA